MHMQQMTPTHTHPTTDALFSLISKTACELSHTLQVAGKDPRSLALGRSATSSSSASILGPITAFATPPRPPKRQRDHGHVK